MDYIKIKGVNYYCVPTKNNTLTPVTSTITITPFDKQHYSRHRCMSTTTRTLIILQVDEPNVGLDIIRPQERK